MHKVTIGNVEITALLDTALLMNPKIFMPSHGDELLAEYRDLADERGLLPMAITCYLIRSAGKNILVDTGIGPRRRGGFPPGHLDQALADAQLTPADIDIVVNTHLHIDHVGWNTFDTDDGRRQVFFPKATFLFQQAEWDYWMTPERVAEPGNSHLRECVAPLADSTHLTLVNTESPVDAHVTFIPTPGHTPGHVAIGILSAGERAVIAGDSSHHPAQLIHPDWSPDVDTDPVQSAQSRDRLFDRVIDEQRTWIAGHWQYPGFGRIVRLDGKRIFKAL